QLFVVGLVHGEKHHVELVYGMRSPVLVDSQQVAIELVSVKYDLPLVGTPATYSSPQYRTQHVDAEQDEAQPVAGVGLVDLHRASESVMGNRAGSFLISRLRVSVLIPIFHDAMRDRRSGH